ncbi:MAG: NAD(P)H-dependent glycerol-3-phosphate dehydrogenase [Clostridiales bacterium]|nr:NAD(P)H-dependent glycerol-3-phosphate dehydrogenase [Clostridiales bacterium]
MKIKVLGAGSWGTTLALLLFENGHHVTLWSWDKDHVERILSDGENRAFLPGVPIPAEMPVSNYLSGVPGVDMLVMAVPSQAVRQVARQIKEYLSANTVIVNAAKGFECGTQLRLSQVLKEELPDVPLVVLSGPSHAEEVARRLPTTIAAASEDLSYSVLVQDIFMNSYLRVYTNKDVAGVEIGGAVKNVIALGTGISDGLGLGDNAKAALITRGLAEITRLGVAMGACRETFSGLAGVGDLFVTCDSMHSRNRRAGIEIGRGRPWNQVLEDMGMVVEGVYATENAYKLAQKHGMEMPITEQIYNVLYEGRLPKDALWYLLSRSKTGENAGLL